MKTIITYQCEICEASYSIKEEAEKCEAVGIPRQTPVGYIFSYMDDDLYKGMTFCVAESRVDQHYKRDDCWAWRDNIHGDSVGKQVCTDGNPAPQIQYNPAWEKLPTFQRMLTYLKMREIDPLVLIGGKYIPYKKAKECLAE